MSTGAVRAGRAEVEIGVKDRLKAGLDAAQRRLQAFGKSMSIAGGVVGGFGSGVVGSLSAMAVGFASVGDAVHKMSARTGISAEELSTLGFAAEQSGSNLQAVEMGFKGMAMALKGAHEGSQSQIDALNRLGLSLDDLEGKNPAEQFKLMSDRISQLEDPTEKAGLAMTLFSEAGLQLIPLMNEGADGIAALQNEARSLGLEMSGDTANSAAALADAMNRLKRSSAAIALVMGEAVAPIITEAIGPIVGVTKAVVAWMAQNKGLVATVFLAGAAVMGIGAGITALGLASMAAGAGIGFLGSAIAFMTSGPVLAIVGTLAAVGAAVYVFRDSIAAMAMQFWDSIEPARAAMTEIFAIVTETFGGIRSALAAGDFSAAARILWLGIQAAFYEGAEVAGMAFEWLFGEATGWLKGIADAVMSGNFSLAFDVVWAQIQLAFATGTTAISRLWAFFVYGLGETFGEVFSGLRGVFFSVMEYISGLLASAAAKLASLLDTLAEYDPTGIAGQTADALRSAQSALRAGSSRFAQQQEQEEAARNARREERFRALNDKLDQADKDLADKRARRDELLDQASQERQDLDMSMAERKRAELLAEIEKFQQEPDVAPSDAEDLSNAAELGTRRAAQSSRTDTGTFSAVGAMILGMGSSTAAERTAENTKRTADGVQQLVNRPQPAAPAFT